MDLFLPVKPTVLIVDDSPVNLSLLGNLLRNLYTVKAVNHGAKALKVVIEWKILPAAIPTTPTAR
jgi:CheY-like chemotaxis protein